jgi:DNA-binding FrmR family transcriptional regulator
MASEGNMQFRSEGTGRAVLDYVEKLAIVREIEGILEDLRALILARSDAFRILLRLDALSNCLTRLEAGILKTHLHGCFKKALETGDEVVVAQTLERMTLHLLRDRV